MEFIIPFKGKVKFKIILDPSVWIFDDRRIDLETYFINRPKEVDELEEYKRGMGEHWSREIMEGATFPPTLKSEKKYKKQQMLTGTFGMKLAPFIMNTEPEADATEIVFETKNGEHRFSMADAQNLIFKFSEKGKPLRQDGPVHILFPDGSNEYDPITDVEAIRVE